MARTISIIYATIISLGLTIFVNQISSTNSELFESSQLKINNQYHSQERILDADEEYVWSVKVNLRYLCSANTEGIQSLPDAVAIAAKKLNKKTIQFEDSAELVSWKEPVCCKRKRKCKKQWSIAIFNIGGKCLNKWGCQKYMLAKKTKWLDPVRIMKRELKGKIPNIKRKDAMKLYVKSWCKKDLFIDGECTTPAPTAAPIMSPDVVDLYDSTIGTISATTGLFKSTPNQPLDAELRTFGQGSMNTYSNCNDLSNDLYNAASIIVNNAIQSTSKCYDGNCIFPTSKELFGPDQDKIDGGENSYGTNNQVGGVDEADIVKSTSDHVFIAYGDRLVVWDASSGEELSVTEMQPKKEKTNEESRTRRKARSLPPPGDNMDPRTEIRGLLLHNNRLGVIVETRRFITYYSLRFGVGTDPDISIISPNSVTTFKLYNIMNVPTDGSELELIGSFQMYGSYNTARSLSSIAHIVTMSPIDTYQSLTKHFNEWNDMYKGLLDSTEYIDVASEYATSTVLPEFVQKLVGEIESIGSGCNNVMKLSMFQTTNREDTDSSVPWLDILIESLAQVSTFDMSGNYPINDEDPSLPSSSTSIFLPNSYGTHVYASSNVLLLTTPGYKFKSDPEAEAEWKENTYIMAFTLSQDGSPAEGRGVGEVPGYILNQWSMDVWESHVRIASISRGRWGCASVEDFCRWSFLTDTDNQISVLRLPSDEEVASGITDMTRVGFLDDLGEPGERIEAVRFMDDKAFLVTFLRTDPFYTIDMSNHTGPAVSGELKISGFSNYLHPYDSEGNVLIAVGQDADSDGRQTGLQISLFDVTNLSNPTMIHRYNVESEPDVWSSSEAQYEHKAFRFLPQSKKLILPASVRRYTLDESFDGFYIFKVSKEDGISLDFEISHVRVQEMSWCWYNAYLPARSLVHNGVVTTMKGHTIFAHELDTSEEVWNLNLDEKNSGDCYFYWF